MCRVVALLCLLVCLVVFLPFCLCFCLFCNMVPSMFCYGLQKLSFAQISIELLKKSLLLLLFPDFMCFVLSFGDNFRTVFIQGWCPCYPNTEPKTELRLRNPSQAGVPCRSHFWDGCSPESPKLKPQITQAIHP